MSNPLEIFDVLLSILENYDQPNKILSKETENQTKFMNIIKYELLSKDHKLNIRNNNWNMLVEIKNYSIKDYVFINYKFKNLDFFCNCEIRDGDIEYLKKCRKLILNEIVISHKNIILLRNCHTLDLSWKGIGDDVVSALKNCHTLYLASSFMIPDASFKKLNCCHTLNLVRTTITDMSAKELKNCHSLNFHGAKVTKKTINELRKNGCIVRT